MFYWAVGNPNMEECINIKFCVKLGKTAETREMLETVYEDKAVSRAQTFW
jgi:hypothetical protein